ncbi:hypothetical protein PBY51_024738 [Eleginops maclovinus]|uniref:Uncharacterized protein n=1 Tax=Eleginops maclovinus TaxID=56733 RepID=A0AAN7XU19_ELEMC|nr:hypothetical protein PBY51_024738 [Eleginops maclovinus]
MDRAERRPKPRSHRSRRWRGFTPAVRSRGQGVLSGSSMRLAVCWGSALPILYPILSRSSSSLCTAPHILMRRRGTLSLPLADVPSSQQYCTLHGTK